MLFIKILSYKRVKLNIKNRKRSIQILCKKNSISNFNKTIK